MSIGREQRIKIRCDQYIKGEITLDAFMELESMSIEESTEEKKLQEEIKRRFNEEMDQEEKTLALYKLKTEASIMHDPVSVNREVRADLQKKSSKNGNLTKEEYDKLPLYKQNEYYNEHPDQVRKWYE